MRNKTNKNRQDGTSFLSRLKIIHLHYKNDSVKSSVKYT